MALLRLVPATLTIIAALLGLVTASAPTCNPLNGQNFLSNEGPAC